MEEAKNNDSFDEYVQKAHAVLKEYDEKIKNIKQQYSIKGRGEYPEEMILRKECNKKIKQFAEEYHID